MSKPAMRLVDATSPPRTPEREALAEAIERHSAARERLAAIKTAQERAFDSVINLKDAVDKAIAALDEAKADESRQLVEAFIGGETAVVASPVKAAVANVEQANDLLDTARRTRAALEAEIKAVESELMFADMALDKCVGDVVRAEPAVRKLAAEYAAAQRRAVDLQRAMEAIQSYLPDDIRYWHGSGSFPDAELVAVAAWRAVLKELRTDADAELPS
jgi:chromosome segregation ATPase